ncbi:hypothetical protein GGX14DRAFT_405782 [Mycena pura]|uniref:Uncharacterized protein n=1 Tax=Mycena pura TaxID=153505 RepID=A0AAD6UVU1_9AGAR|nr:hypothetical protein GGX14DRAFT_405782 [Mycena pura]
MCENGHLSKYLNSAGSKASWILHVGAFFSADKPIEQIQGFTKVIWASMGLHIQDPPRKHSIKYLNSAGSKASWILHVGALFSAEKPIEQIQVRKPIEQIQGFTKVVWASMGLHIQDPPRKHSIKYLNSAGSKASWILHVGALFSAEKPIEQIQVRKPIEQIQGFTKVVWASMGLHIQDPPRKHSIKYLNSAGSKASWILHVGALFSAEKPDSGH